MINNAKKMGERGKFSGPKLCHFFVQGICNKNENCTYSHDLSLQNPTATGAMPGEGAKAKP